MLKTTIATLALLVVPATTASALTLVNKDTKEHTVGLDAGAKEFVEKIAAGATANFKDKCPDGCGVTGPWHYSVLLKPGEKWEFDGKALVTDGTVKPAG